MNKSSAPFLCKDYRVNLMNNKLSIPDERVKEMSTFRNSLIRPELGGIIGTIVVFIIFIISCV